MSAEAMSTETMGAKTPTATKERRSSKGHPIVLGAGMGVIAAWAMAAYAMVAGATYQGSGFFTPLYHIASLLISPEYMDRSMQQADAGHAFTVFAVPAIVGACIHMTTGAAFGMIFGSIVAAAPAIANRYLALAMSAGAVWGAMVYLASSFVLLSLAVTIFGSGDQIENMSSLVGQGTFLLEHTIYGVTLGALMWRATRRQR